MALEELGIDALEHRDGDDHDQRPGHVKERKGGPRCEEEVQNAKGRVQHDHNYRGNEHAAPIAIGDPFAPAAFQIARGHYSRSISMKGLMPVSSSSKRTGAPGAPRRPISTSSVRDRWRRCQSRRWSR